MGSTLSTLHLWRERVDHACSECGRKWTYDECDFAASGQDAAALAVAHADECF